MSLDNAVEDLSAVLGHPLVVVDVDWNVAAASFHDSDREREQLSLTLTVSNQELAEALLQAESARVRRGAIRVPTQAEATSRVVAPLNHDSRLVGYVTYLEDVSVEIAIAPAIQEALDKASPELALRVALWAFEQRNRTGHTRKLIRDLLADGRRQRQAAAAALIDEGLVSDSGESCVLVLRSRSASDRLSARWATERTLRLVSRSTTVRVAGATLGEEGVFVFPRRVNPERLSVVLRGDGLDPVCAGIGSIKGSLIEAADSYREAQIAWQASARDTGRYGRASFWDDLGADRLLLQLPLDELAVTDFTPAVRAVLALPSGSDLGATVDAFLATDGHVVETARALHIHRSTLYYRLDRIKDLTGSDLHDSKVRHDLLVGLRVARLSGRFEGR